MLSQLCRGAGLDERDLSHQVAAHGILIVTPVQWYLVSSPVKLMMDRLVCADGGNPDPTLTQGAEGVWRSLADIGPQERGRQIRSAA